jgi:hypothetical protein
MKSPAELKLAARRQWENSSLREARLLGGASAWPIFFSIGRPSPQQITHALDEVKLHIDTWRRVKLGEVVWQSVRYRAVSSSVDVPVAWKLLKPSDWMEAASDPSVRQEFQSMGTLVLNQARLESHFV